MSAAATPPHPPTEPTHGGAPPPERVLRLPIWVSVVLILTLFASCAAADNANNAASNSASTTSSPQGGVDSDLEIQAMCRLLGAVAAKQGIDVSAVFTPAQGTMCQQVAQEATGRP